MLVASFNFFTIFFAKFCRPVPRNIDMLRGADDSSYHVNTGIIIMTWNNPTLSHFLFIFATTNKCGSRVDKWLASVNVSTFGSWFEFLLKNTYTEGFHVDMPST